MSLGKWAENWILVLGPSKRLDNWCKWFGKYDEDGHCSLATGIIHAHLMDVVVLACGGKENAFVGPLVGITWAPKMLSRARWVVEGCECAWA
jgi:hypothetical protein